MIVSLDQLSSCEFTVSDIRFYRRQQPSYRQIRQKSRKVNGLIAVLKGACRFTFEGGGFDLAAGAVAYVPFGSKHVFDILSEGTVFYRVDFHIASGGEPVLFSRTPLKLCQSAPAEFSEACRAMEDNDGYVQDSLSRTMLLCTMLRSLSAISAGYYRERLAPAAAFLSEHLTEKIRCDSLAAMCNLSPSRFYCLFRQEYGKTPLEYRDELLMKRALLLLQSDCNVGEAAEALGFGSAAYFSRFFKKHRGVAPSDYMMKQRGGI